MIARIWRGTTRPGESSPYVSHLTQTVVPELSAIRGFRGLYVLERPQTNGDEFVVLTLWDSVEAIRRFAGVDGEAAVVPPAAQALLASYDARASHYEVVLAGPPERAALP